MITASVSPRSGSLPAGARADDRTGIGCHRGVAFVVMVLVVGALIAYAIYQWGQHLATSKKTRAALTANDEYRRLSEMAVTAQEHTDLKLAEINMQLAQLRDQLDQVQKVLRDVG